MTRITPYRPLQTILERDCYQNKALNEQDISTIQVELHQKKFFRRLFPQLASTLKGPDALNRTLYHSSLFLEALRKRERPKGPFPTVFSEQDLIKPGGKQGSTALMFAIFHHHVDIAKHLMAHMTPEQLATQNRLGYSALTFAATHGHTEIVNTLLPKLSVIDAINQLQVMNTPLTQRVLEDYIRADPNRSYLFCVTPDRHKMKLPKAEKIPTISEEQKQQIYGTRPKTFLATYISKHVAFLSEYEKEQLQTVLNNVEFEEQITAVPRNALERRAFYARMRTNLEHVALQLANPDVPLELKKAAMIGILESAGLCGTKQYQEVSTARKFLTTDTHGSAILTPQDELEQILYRLRVKIIETIATRLMSANPTYSQVHIYNGIMASIGSELGVADPDLDYAADPLTPKIDRANLLKIFYSEYTASKIIKAVSLAKPATLHALLGRCAKLEWLYKDTENSESPDYFALTDWAIPYMLVSIKILDFTESLERPNPPFLQEFGL